MAYALVNAGHILGIALILGAILPLDLRLLGFLNGPSLAVLAPFLSRVAAVGVGLAILTGLMLVSVRPAEYLANPAFRIKILLIGVALANVMLIHAGKGWRGLPHGRSATSGLRLGAAVSALLWLGAMVAGRLIGFM